MWWCIFTLDLRFSLETYYPGWRVIKIGQDVFSPRIVIPGGSALKDEAQYY